MSPALESLVRLRPTGELAWIGSLRERAIASFLELGLPTRRLEAWKGTNFAPLAAMHFTRVGPGEDSPGDRSAGADADPPELVFVDGRFDAKASCRSNLPDGIRALSLAEVLDEEPALLDGKLGQLPDLKRNSLVALQTAFLEDVAVIVLDAGVETSRPLRMRFISTAATETTNSASAAFPRLLVIAGKGSAATLFQEHRTDGAAPGFTGFVAEYHLAEGANIETVQIQAEGTERIHFTSAYARLERDARFDSHVFSLGNGLVRSELEVRLVEPGAQTKLCGLFIGRDRGHTDHYTTVDHDAERCTSDEEYRGVLGDHSEGVFRGRVIIRPGAQKSDVRQSSPNLLLSDHAKISTKPQLEIYADDIRASHGSTIGQLDSDAIFYLRARGISAANARLLLTSAFAQGIVDRIADETLRKTVGSDVNEALRNLEHNLETVESSEEGMKR